MVDNVLRIGCFGYWGKLIALDELVFCIRNENWYLVALGELAVLMELVVFVLVDLIGTLDPCILG